MFGKSVALIFMALAGCAPIPSSTAAQPSALETKSDSRAQGAALAKACEGRDGWSDAAPPAHVFGNVYMVDTCGITALLITTPQGHYLIDGATDEAAEGIAANIRSLGFKPEDVKLLLITHEHLDHAGGISRLKQITQSKFAARQQALAAMESGLPQADDPQHGLHPAFPGVKGDFLIGDGDTLRLGDHVVTAMATPGHSPGGTSYAWESCDGEVCRTFVYADSLNAVSADDYRFIDHPEYVATLRQSMARIEALPNCDIMISPHPFQSDFFERLAGEKPLIDPAGCKRYVAAARNRLDVRLVNETAPKEASADQATQ